MAGGDRGRGVATVTIVTVDDATTVHARTWPVPEDAAAALADALGDPVQDTIMPVAKGRLASAWLRKNAYTTGHPAGGNGDVAG